ncbi:MAG TPA: prepilin-type N-terminal cleavage/methylation domain-containing protein [Candidatus Ozemobacteraceae bacterium]|nr:prepilin-type N-terminal cleavage/methylation domain-containing protein [Candidatus Ozemobacteraceae bacterium]
MNQRRGLSLVEILLALIIMAGSVVSILRGLEVQESLEHQARFETQAALYAERELELL